jgi:hypothetical protein
LARKKRAFIGGATNTDIAHGCKRLMRVIVDERGVSIPARN